MFFKSVLFSDAGELSSGCSGIGVVMERSPGAPVIQVSEKKLDLYVVESVAEYLASMDGLVEALMNNALLVFEFMDSRIVYDQIIHGERLENQLLIAMRQRVLEHVSNVESFVLKLVPSIEPERPSRLA
ncbi:hypothetical protein NE237_016940 [Protea cynaroides]|uniref:RNase H type-1 domain-containing protein n=1 Tax=Protea cynaroides TaxID=273540 RepID=A0A9Q0HEH7_9MAGN|nr:hypothetical protein NE237_016940 [Protea cynaroides]